MVELKFFCCFDREVKKKEVFPFCIVKWRFGRNFSVLFSRRSCPCESDMCQRKKTQRWQVLRCASRCLACEAWFLMSSPPSPSPTFLHQYCIPSCRFKSVCGRLSHLQMARMFPRFLIMSQARSLSPILCRLCFTLSGVQLVFWSKVLMMA